MWTTRWKRRTGVLSAGLATALLFGLAGSACADLLIKAKASRTGTIDPSGKVLVFEGDTQEFTIAPVDPARTSIHDVVVDGVSQGPVTSYSFPEVDAPHRIIARFRKRTYALGFVEPDPSLGSLRPTAAGAVTYGKSVSLTATPVGELPAWLVVDGVPVVGAGPGEAVRHTLVVTADHVVTARFGWICENGGDDYPACTPPPVDIHASAAGTGLDCSPSSPCDLAVALAKARAGSVVHVAAGSYVGTFRLGGKSGIPSEPVTIVADAGAVVHGGLVVERSSWVILEGFGVVGEDTVTVRTSSYVTVRDCDLDYVHAGVFTTHSSHLLVEDNEIHQSFPPGSTWTDLKNSEWEGGGFYASSHGRGMIHIRRNTFRDSFNGVYLTDDSEGRWMNSNVFISQNTFVNIVDDPFEPEGDSFNLHFFGNALVDTHRMVSLVPTSTCLGPVFVYGNVQLNDADPTGEAAQGRRNSALKLDTAGGECPNGIHVFNNTVLGTVGNFFGLDLLESTVKNVQLLNNVFVTEHAACSTAPTLVGSLFDYNLADGPFGYVQDHGIQADPLLEVDGSLGSGSPASGAGTSVTIADYFASPAVVAEGEDLGAFRSFPEPAYVVPPGGEPVDFPANVPGWPGP